MTESEAIKRLEGRYMNHLQRQFNNRFTTTRNKSNMSKPRLYKLVGINIE